MRLLIVDGIFKYIGLFFIVIGSLTSIVSAIGLLRFPDVYSRAHAATKTTTVAVLITLVGIFIYYIAAESFMSIRILLTILFVFLTAPVSGHLILRASYRAKVKLADSSIKDELRDYFAQEEHKKE